MCDQGECDQEECVSRMCVISVCDQNVCDQELCDQELDPGAWRPLVPCLWCPSEPLWPLVLVFFN